MIVSRRLLPCLVVCAGVSICAAEVDPADRTAALPDSWLILYNANDPESVSWKDAYMQSWGVPLEHALGLDVSSVDERVHRDTFTDRIYVPVRDYLEANPEISNRIMGILVGYHVPGCFYIDETRPALQGGGGWSVSNNLQDLTSSTYYKRPNPHQFIAYWDTNQTQLTKATLTSGCYLTARLDGPTLSVVTHLTDRALAISGNDAPLSFMERLYFDYWDDDFTPNDWKILRFATEEENTSLPVWMFPWQEFESETEPTPNCAVRFSYYRITGWETVDWGGTPAGTRIVGMAMNSWGATTVRSTTDHDGRYVPNAIVQGGFAGAVGATAEPYQGNEPDPSTIVWCLSQGWTLGEAVFRANPRRNYMWELVGDPLLRVPAWFQEPSIDFDHATYAVGEGDGSVSVGVSLSHAHSVTVTVDYASADGTASAGSDYTSVTGTLTFSPGETAGAINLAVADDAVDEDDETIILTLSNPTTATLAGVNNPTTITITDNDVTPPPDADDDGVPDESDNCPTVANSDQADADGDDVGDACDNCPNDINKIEPGICGCGTPDTDGDGDGTPDCNDNCPNDSNKTEPGICGCGTPDTDGDGDGTPDCNDNCPNDISKTEPGICGCGTPDADGDGDGTPDCNDNCPNDIDKTEPGICGCGVPDTDGDGDGIPDCNDNCPNDSNKTEPGICGCGTPDSNACEQVELRVTGPGGVVEVYTYAFGATATVAAPAAPEGQQFSRWSGDVSGSDNPVSILMDGDKAVVAHYEECPIQPAPCGPGVPVCGLLTVLGLGMMKRRVRLHPTGTPEEHEDRCRVCIVKR